jgi:heme/copper-type cytochrome/quinol oxidase subunit 3
VIASRTAIVRRPPALLTDHVLLGMALFIGSESVFFLSVVAAFIANRDAGLADARQHLELVRTAIFSIALFASSGTMAVASSRQSRTWLVATFALGAIFLSGQGSEYARLLGTGIGPSSALFGTTFFTLTGLHALHVLVGLVALAALAAATVRRNAAVAHVAWESVSLYWHFVDAVWVVVFSVVYLGTLL